MSQLEVGNVKIGLNDDLYNSLYKLFKGELASVEKINTDLFAVVYRGEYKNMADFKDESNSNIDITESKYDINSVSGYLLYKKTAGVWGIVGNNGGVDHITDISMLSSAIDTTKLISFNDDNNVINFEVTFKNTFYIPLGDFVGNISGIVFFTDTTPAPYIYLNIYPFEKKDGDLFSLKATLNLSDI